MDQIRGHLGRDAEPFLIRRTRAARRIPRRRKHANRQVILITDEEGTVYRNTFGLDPKIVN